MENQLKQTGSYELEGRISSLIWDSYTKSRIYISDWNGYVHLLRYQKVGGRIAKLKEPKRVLNSIYSMDEYRRGAPDGNSSKVVLGGGDGEIVLYDVETQEIQEIGRDPEGRAAVKIISIQERDEIFTFSWDKTMQMWDISKKKLLYTHKLKENFVTAEYISPYIVVVFGNNTIAFLDMRNYGKGSSMREKPIGCSDIMVKSLAFNKSLDYMALGDIAGNIKILERKTDICDFNMLNTRDKLIGKDYSILFEYQAHSKKYSPKDKVDAEQNKVNKVVFSVNSVDFNPKNSKVVSSAGGDGSIYSIHTQYERGLQHDSYSNERENISFKNPFTHLKYNSEGNALLTAQIEDNYIEVFQDPDVQYRAKSVVRIFNVVDTQALDSF